MILHWDGRWGGSLKESDVRLLDLFEDVLNYSEIL